MKINVDSNAAPSFCKPHAVPYAMREKVEAELDRLVAEGELVEHSHWAALLMAMVRSNQKSVRICDDFRVTVNPLLKLHCYPIPKIDDIFATTRGWKDFYQN